MVVYVQHVSERAMHGKMTITLDEAGYGSSCRPTGERRIGRFVEKRGESRMVSHGIRSIEAFA
jgi:hypothetical protein